MMLNGVRLMICLAVALGVSACAPKQQLSPAVVSSGPDEFGIVPNRPLTAPSDFAVLPVPTRGGSNLADVRPEADAIVALGGRAPSASGVDGGIVNYASRYGVDPAVRVTLAASDESFLKRRNAVPSLPWTKFKYERAYRGFALDPWKELARLQALGVAVPSAPPAK